MLRYFRRRRPQHRAETPVSPQDKLIAAHHGYTPERWAQLPALVKQDLRESVAWELREAS
ncbi:hypothetical protein [Pseudarthrobacter sp. NIBRBAC000502771]|uniref:hypothetical protein n=1 Tax=Pseudarthrobacter sp. NIBRBAC000502771 TaxID=2590774 RepID=UPI0011304A54|nr:hypothetical protein [Pseudarthrobacter sp. NIBRBAC000502771]QDG61223.1 hypothetical protein NIBR502771_02135 [Pseudarthrobacter sp. NIBRBAC000502771]